MSPSSQPSEKHPYPGFFIVRNTGEIVPLIPVDELPLEINVIGVDRSIDLAAAIGMQNLGLQKNTGSFYQIQGQAKETPDLVLASKDTQERDEVTNAPKPLSLLHTPTSGRHSPSPSVSTTSSGSSITFTSNSKTSLTSNQPRLTTLQNQSPLSSPRSQTCRHWCRHGMCKWGQQCHYRHIMPMSISGLREVGLTDWPTWYRGMNPEYFAPSTFASTRAGCGNGNRRTRARGCGNDYCHLRPEDVRNAALDGAGRGGTGGYPNGAYPARGRGARSNGDDLGEHILARLRGLARQDAIVGSVERKAAVARPGSARNNVLIERAADRDAKNWEEESSVGEAKAKVAGGEKEKLVDV